MNANTKYTCHDFFRAVDRRIEKQMPAGQKTSFQIRVGKHIIEQRFTQPEHAQTVAKYLVGLILEEPVDNPDSIFYYWTEDCTPYLPRQAAHQIGVWQSQDNTGYIRITPNYGMEGVDYTRQIFYFCRHPSKATEYMLYGHAMIVAFGQWAAQNDMLLLHSACVGVDGKGVLLSARGGGGKSTLSVSCLLDGFDFVADDYVLVNQRGPLHAMPLYRSVGLNQDMAAVLNPGLPVLRVDKERNDKLLLDASRFTFCPQLPVRAILYPHVCEVSSPVIVPTTPGPVLAKLIDSTAGQLGVLRNPKPYRQMAARLLGIPVYEIRLSKDLKRNTQCLKKFITKEL